MYYTEVTIPTISTKTKSMTINTGTKPSNKTNCVQRTKLYQTECIALFSVFLNTLFCF